MLKIKKKQNLTVIEIHLKKSNIIYNMSILDTDVPEINVKLLRPKIASIVRKNANEIAEWILNIKDVAIKKCLPSKLLKLVESSVYTDKGRYWKLNTPYSDECLIRE